ncbi:MAG: hypothetical protein AB2687_16100, partial [Candidatus Thiodiazotropha taylori]
MQTAAISTSVNESVLESILSAWQRRAGLITTLGFTLFSLLLLYMAWLNHSQAVWTAEAGWGYWLGIVGGSMMLLLLLYPMRKRLHFMSKWLTVKFWFRLHMVFGV